MKTKKKPSSYLLWSLALALLLLAYVGSYSVLSVKGGWIVTESGRLRWIMGLAEIDVVQWQPLYGFCQPFEQVGGNSITRHDGLGLFYKPLILLDQKYIHKTIPLWNNPGNPEEGVNYSQIPDIEHWHPKIQNKYAGTFPLVDKSEIDD